MAEAREVGDANETADRAALVEVRQLVEIGAQREVERPAVVGEPEPAARRQVDRVLHPDLAAAVNRADELGDPVETLGDRAGISRAEDGLVVEIAAVWAYRRIGAQKMWVVFVPILLLAATLVADEVNRFLPNLL